MRSPREPHWITIALNLEESQRTSLNHYSIESIGVSVNLAESLQHWIYRSLSEPRWITTALELQLGAKRTSGKRTTAIGTAGTNGMKAPSRTIQGHHRDRIPGNCIDHTTTVNCRNQGNQWKLYCSGGFFVFCMRGTGETKKNKKTAGATGTWATCSCAKI